MMTDEDAPAIPEQAIGSTRLLLVGLLFIAFGVLCFFTALQITIESTRDSIDPMDWMPYLPTSPSLEDYAIAGIGILLAPAALITIGAGLIAHRRWALSLVALAAWWWFFIGVSALHAYLTRFGLGRGAVELSLLCCLPLLLVAWLQRPSVLEACEQRDSDPGWTDAFPFSILLHASLLATWLLSSFLVPFRGAGVELLFETLGPLRSYALLAVLSAAGLYLAWGLCRLKPPAWRASLAYFLILTMLTRAPGVLSYLDESRAAPPPYEQSREAFWLAALLVLTVYNARYFQARRVLRGQDPALPVSQG